MRSLTCADMGVIALLKDIINGNLPERARQLLLASRLVALTKPNDGKYRPIAVGELYSTVWRASSRAQGHQRPLLPCSLRTSWASA